MNCHILQKNFRLKVLGLSLGLMGTIAFAASNTIEKIDVSALPGDKTLLKIHLQKPAQKPTGFSVATPPRVALDFADVTNGTSSDKAVAPQGNVRAVNLVEANGRTRLVVSLLQNAPYEVTTDGQDVLVTLSPALNAQVALPASTIKNDTVTTNTTVARDNGLDLVQDIEFRKGVQGEGRILIDLSKGTAGVDIRQQGKSLIVDLAKARLPENLQRRLDVVDFGTAVMSVEAKAQGGNARLTIEPKGNWEYSSYQMDNKLVVEVKEASTDKKDVQKVYAGEKLSLNFQNVDVRSVLAVLADFTGMNIITSDTVSGNLTLRLKDVPWDQAFDIVLQAKGLDSRKKGNVVLVAPRDELATKEKLELETKQNIAELEPLKTEVFQINYQKAKIIFDFLKDEKYPFLSKRGSVISDERTNQIFLKDIPSKLDEFRELLRKIDIPTRQVLIEARIVIADQDFSSEMGGMLKYFPSGGSRTFWGSKTTTIGSGSSMGGGLTSLTQRSGGGLFSLALTTAAGETLSLGLSAMELDNRGKIVSSPRVVTMDQQKAIIKQGEKIPYLTCTASTTTTVGVCTTSFQDVYLSLEVTPQITPDNKINLSMLISKDKRGASTDAGFLIDSNQITTQALLANGETTVVGGIFQEEHRADTTKTPVLGDVPLFGWLFKNNNKVDKRTELMIFITPRILDDRIAVR